MPEEMNVFTWPYGYSHCGRKTLAAGKFKDVFETGDPYSTPKKVGETVVDRNSSVI